MYFKVTDINTRYSRKVELVLTSPATVWIPLNSVVKTDIAMLEFNRVQMIMWEL
jgi:hypothetical protein